MYPAMIDLHRHLAGSQSPRVRPDKSLNDFLAHFSAIEEEQRSPEVLKEALRVAFNKDGCAHVEVRFDPLVRTGVITLEEMGELIADELPSHGRVIYCMGRHRDVTHNRSILDAACAHKAVSGIDMAGPENGVEFRHPHWTLGAVGRAVSAGLLVTWHFLETTAYVSNARFLAELVEHGVRRIGHGIALRLVPEADRTYLYHCLRRHDVCLELCPMVNYHIGAIAPNEMHDFMQELIRFKVPFCLNTDNPAMVGYWLPDVYDQVTKDAADWSKLCAERAKARIRQQCSRALI